jgi:hypothetical protein
MNVDTLALTRRSYSDLVDDLLTAVVGGVVNEPIPFDLKQLRYALSQPGTRIRSVKGTIADANGKPVPEIHLFLLNVDYTFSASDSSIVWLPKGTQPLDETNFYVDYFRANSQSPLTDINVGSVTRTFTEAIGREIATVYQEIYNAYLSGFVDTAQAQSLDYVVSILGVVRYGAEYATGLVTFLRDPAVDGNVTIADGTQVATADRKVFETTELRTLQKGQQRLDVPIRAVGAAKGPLGVVSPGTMVTLDPPIAGIGRVTNFEATVLGAAPETDDQLRARAKATLQGLGQATLAALKRVVFDERSKVLDVRDPNGAPDKISPPGTVVLLVDTEPARFASVNASVQETRAAGILATVVARYVFITPRLALTSTTTLTPAGKLKLIGQIIDALQAYVDTLQPGDLADSARMLAAINAIPEVNAAKPRFLDILVSQASVDDPGSKALVNALVDAARAAGNDPATLATGIANVLAGASTATFGGTLDATPLRSLTKGPGGTAAAKDEDIEAGTFTVTLPAPVGDDKWSIALAMQPSDVQLLGGS